MPAPITYTHTHTHTSVQTVNPKQTQQHLQPYTRHADLRRLHTAEEKSP